MALGGRETIADVARNLERWVAGAVVRTYAQSRLEAFAAAAPRLRVVNALTDEEHPCQALADCLTLIERWGSLEGRRIAFGTMFIVRAAVCISVNLPAYRSFRLQAKILHHREKYFKK